MNTTSGKNQGNTNFAANRTAYRNDLIKEWDTLIAHVEENKKKSSSSSKQNPVFVPALDLSAVRAAQQTITQPVGSRLIPPISSTTTTTYRMADPANDSPRTVEALFLGFSPKSNLKNGERSEESTSSSSRSRRTDSPGKNEAYPNSSRIRSSSAAEKEKKSASQKSLPATTPRGEEEVHTSNTPRTPRGTAMHEFRKKISRKFSDIDLSKITSSLKVAASSMKETLSASSTPRKQSPRAAKEEILTTIPIGVRNRLARQILELRQSEGFDKQSINKQTMLMHAILLQELAEDSPLRTSEGLKVLLEDVNLRNQYHIVDTVVDLSDSKFIKHINSSAQERFVDKWLNDTSTMEEDLKKHLKDVRPTFARDFGNSTYQVRQADGSLRTLGEIDEFIAYINGDAKSELAMVVSNIASQNLGIFFKNVLFERKDTNGIHDSLLKLYDGTSIKPHANVKATYVFKKEDDGTVLIDYTYQSSNDLNGHKEIAAMECAAWNSHVMNDASLTIKARITIKPDGEWHIGNPHVQAEGWNQTQKY